MGQATLTRVEARRQVRLEARRSLGLSRRELATRCGWRGISCVAKTEQNGTPFPDLAEAMYWQLRREAERQGKSFPYKITMYL